MTQAILFSAKPSMVDIDDARDHLSDHPELYWEVGFPIRKDRFSFPLAGFIHVAGSQVEFRVTINDIIPFSAADYESQTLADRVKPEKWIHDWKLDVGGARTYPWRTTLVITQITPFSADTKSFVMENGKPVSMPPRRYIRVLLPNASPQLLVRPAARIGLADKNLEDFIIQQLDEIESGLSLISRQLHTPAGRLDLLCKDAAGNYVVVELKKHRGNDEVVGQTLRYMGWVMEEYPNHKVRGIVIVGRKDEQLRYAIKATHGVEAKEFRISIE